MKKHLTMKMRLPPLPPLPVCAIAASLLTSIAAAAVGTLPIPAEFMTEPARSNVTVVFARSAGEVFNPIDKRAIEAQCEMARQSGQTQKHPVFEAGHDKPVKTTSLRFSTATQSAHLTTLYAYECTRAQGRPAGADGLCGCTYQVQPRWRVEITNQLSTGAETLTIDITKGTGQRRVKPGVAKGDAARNAERVAALAPEVVGRDVIAGIPCVVRRQALGAGGHIDRCIAEDPEHHLPDWLRYQALSETVPSQDGKSTYRWTRTDEVVMNATVDAGVFKVPRGITLKESP